MVNVDRSTVNMGRVSNGPIGLRVGPVWAGLGQTRGRLWHSHVTAMGPYWASSTARLTPCGPRWTSAHGPWTYSRAHGGPSPPSLLPVLAHVHRAHARAVGERGVFPCFLPRRCSCRRRAHGEPPWWRWCPIGEGKSFPGPWRLCQWGQSGGQSFPKVLATASGGSSSSGVREWRGAVA